LIFLRSEKWQDVVVDAVVKADSLEAGYSRHFTPRKVESMRETNRWKRVSTAREIQNLIELLDAPSEHDLKTTLVNLFILEQQKLQQSNAAEISDNQEVIKDINPTSQSVDDEASAANERSEDGDSEQDQSYEEVRTPKGGKKGRKSETGANVPFALKLLTSKGPDISKNYVIEQENAFEGDANVENEGNEDDEQRSFEYFTFSKGRKYVNILNCILLFE